ncbi:receptor-type tyrosine-protein phosphatase delta-like [Chelonoidis abingdonii]|uniref:receptor-type tyrosine-protein phosphatase delta-like n=1 Tax=Chelonoidis abingdonii TaxID=106734 RepID=UPI003F4947E7
MGCLWPAGPRRSHGQLGAFPGRQGICSPLSGSPPLIPGLTLLICRKKRNDSDAHKSNGAIPLKRKRGAGASKLRTQIPVAELLESLKRFKRAEMEEEGTEDDANPERPPAGRNAEYQKLVSGLLDPGHTGKEPCNQAKNRYKSVIPYDHCRVVLQSASPGADYINASYVDSYRSPRFFIAAQGECSWLGTMAEAFVPPAVFTFSSSSSFRQLLKGGT